VEPIIEKANKDASIQRWAQNIPVKAPRPIENAIQDLRQPGAVAAISEFPKSKPPLHRLDFGKADVNI
jgi:hypothetical protein